jgi:hypothetical protein
VDLRVGIVVRQWDVLGAELEYLPRFSLELLRDVSDREGGNAKLRIIAENIVRVAVLLAVDREGGERKKRIGKHAAHEMVGMNPPEEAFGSLKFRVGNLPGRRKISHR